MVRGLPPSMSPGTGEAGASSFTYGWEPPHHDVRKWRARMEDQPHSNAHRQRVRVCARGNGVEALVLATS